MTNAISLFVCDHGAKCCIARVCRTIPLHPNSTRTSSSVCGASFKQARQKQSASLNHGTYYVLKPG